MCRPSWNRASPARSRTTGWHPGARARAGRDRQAQRLGGGAQRSLTCAPAAERRDAPPGTPSSSAVSQGRSPAIQLIRERASGRVTGRSQRALGAFGFGLKRPVGESRQCASAPAGRLELQTRSRRISRHVKPNGGFELLQSGRRTSPECAALRDRRRGRNRGARRRPSVHPTHISGAARIDIRNGTIFDLLRAPATRTRE